MYVSVYLHNSKYIKSPYENIHISMQLFRGASFWFDEIDCGTIYPNDIEEKYVYLDTNIYYSSCIMCTLKHAHIHKPCRNKNTHYWYIYAHVWKKYDKEATNTIFATTHCTHRLVQVKYTQCMHIVALYNRTCFYDILCIYAYMHTYKWLHT